MKDCNIINQHLITTYNMNLSRIDSMNQFEGRCNVASPVPKLSESCVLAVLEVFPDRFL